METGRPRLLVVGVEGLGVDEKIVKLLDGTVAAAFAESGAFDVISQADLQRMLAIEEQRALVGCDDDGSCFAEIAGALGARYVVHGRVGGLDRTVVLQLSVFDAQIARTEVGREVRGPSFDVVAEKIPGAVRAMVGELTGAPLPAPAEPAVDAGLLWTGAALAAGGVLLALPAAAVAVWADQELAKPGSEVDPATKEQLLGAGRLSLVALGVGVVAVAAGVVVGGLAFVE